VSNLNPDQFMPEHDYRRVDDDERGRVRMECSCGKRSKWSDIQDLHKAQDRHADQVAR
jgi:hypothetical protein